MKKKLLNKRLLLPFKGKQFQRTMKLTLMAVFLICMQLSAKVYSQKEIKLSFDIKKIKLAKALERIEVASDYRFFYNARQIPLDKMVALTTNGNKSISEILQPMLQPVNLRYQILANNVIALTTSGDLKFLIVNGLVKDSKNEPLPGVSVKVKGTNTGAVTDRNGKFRIDAPDNSTLVVTYIGYQTQELPLADRNKLDITLLDDLKSLTEVVVVGYGTQKKVLTTAAVSTLKGDVIAQNPVANINNSIAGRVSGVIAFQGSGEPGARCGNYPGKRDWNYRREEQCINCGRRDPKKLFRIKS